jgi:predicted nucleic acid-binding protein
VVFDASTAILLAKLGLLRQVVSKASACMGKQAAAEALAKETDDARVIAALIEEGLIEQQAVTGNLEQLTGDFRLDIGEAEAILLARASGLPCATDDGPAIRCCKVLGVPFVTAVGFLVGLVESGDVDAERGHELLSKLERFGRYHARILDDAARRIRATADPGEQR